MFGAARQPEVSISTGGQEKILAVLSVPEARQWGDDAKHNGPLLHVTLPQNNGARTLGTQQQAFSLPNNSRKKFF